MAKAKLAFNSAEGPDRKNQFYCAITASLLYMCIGTVTAWPSASLSILRKQGLTETQETWMVSLSMLGSCLGPTLFTITIDRFGRKFCVLLADGIYIVSWIILSTGHASPIALCVGRFIGGLANGYTMNTVPNYVTEISDVKMRQTLASLPGPCVSLGLLVQYAAGPWLSYQFIILVSALPALLVFLLWFRLKESPYHLVARGKTKEATDVLIWLRGSSPGLQEELQEIENLVEDLKSNKGNKADLFRRKGPRNALILSSLIFFIQPFSGVDVIGSYLDQILSETTLSIPHKYATVIIGSINTFFALCEPFVVHRVGSKWTMIVCSFCCSSSLLVFGVYKYFDERHYNMSSVTSLPIACVISFELFFGLGYSNLPWSISAELFSPVHKGFAGNLVTTMNCIMAFVAISLYGYMKPITGASIYFIGTTIFFILGDILVACFLPNTAGLSLEKIQEILENEAFLF